MSPKRLIVVLDANVLFPFTLRDTLLRASEIGFFELRLSSKILDEMTRNLVSSSRMTAEKASILLEKIVQRFSESIVDDYEDLLAAMRNQEKDRHVVAAACRADAGIIVTFNLRDFKNLPEGIEALTPDAFLVFLYSLSPKKFVEMLRAQAQDLRNPPMSLEDLLHRLAHTTPKLVEAVRHFVASS